MPSRPTRPLGGRVVLIVQRSWIIANGLAIAFKAAGAQVLVAKQSDLALADHPDLAAAVLDGQSSEMRLRLEARGIPFLLYTGHGDIEGGPANAPIVRKPAPPAEVVARVEQLLG
jgi:DNA-binding response OmpR family regulator